MPTMMPVTSHDQKILVECYFDHCELTNAVVPLKMPSASYDAHVSTKFITWLKCHVAPHFNYLDYRNAVVQLMMPLASHYQKSMCISFWSSQPNKFYGVIDDTVGIMWLTQAWMALQDQKGYVAQCFNHLDLMNKMFWLTVALTLHGADSSNHSFKILKGMLHLILNILS